MPDGAATRVSYGLLNLTRRDSHEAPTKLRPGRRYKVTVRLNETAHRFGKGSRVRLALSTAYWPIVWPAPEPVTLTIHTKASALELPVRPTRREDDRLAPFLPAESAPPLKQTWLRPAHLDWTITKDIVSGEVRYARDSDDGKRRLDEIDWTVAVRSKKVLTIRPDDPLSARGAIETQKEFSRGSWRTRIECQTTMSLTRRKIRITATLKAYEGGKEVFARSWDEAMPRDQV